MATLGKRIILLLYALMGSYDYTVLCTNNQNLKQNQT